MSEMSSQLTLQKIETVVKDIVQDLVRNKCPLLERENLALRGRRQRSSVEWAYKRSRRKFAVLLTLIDNIYYLVNHRTIRTKRDLYYENTGLYGNQGVLDCAVENIEEILQLPRSMLNIEATAKGLIAGSLQWVGPNNEYFDANIFTAAGMLIPSNMEGHHNFVTEGKFILVVEKDAIFQKLLNDRVFDALGKFILVTGKGYPDLGTRSLLHKLSRELKLKVLALVDSDPHGIEIAAIYKWGSYGQVRKADNDSNFISQQTVPDLIWIGLLPSDITSLALQAKTEPLTDRDKKKLDSIEIRLQEQVGSQPWIRELNKLRLQDRKAELEVLESRFLTEIYLRSKIEKVMAGP